MCVIEEFDVMCVMGILYGLWLVLFCVFVFGVVMLLFVMWINIIVLMGGVIVVKFVFGIDVNYFVCLLLGVVLIVNLYIGFGKGVVFGMLIVLVVCYFGFWIKVNL